MEDREIEGGVRFEVLSIGVVHSTLLDRSAAPKQAWEGAPQARIEIHPAYRDCLLGLEAGQEIWIFTWFHQARRSVFQVHPRGLIGNPLMGVFATRSPDRPNPIGLHRATITSVDPAGWLTVDALEAIDGTPVADIKPALECRT